MKNYSHRKLSFETDRLPAISAVALVVADATGDDYLAGLWRGNLLAGLCWFPTYGSASDARPLQEYIAPTWSWVSHRDDPDQALVPSEASYDVSSSHRTRHSHDANLDASVLDAWTTLEGQNPYGPVSDAVIVLSALHCDAELTIPKDGDYPQLDFGHAEVEKAKLDNLFSVLDCMPVEPDTNVDRLGRNSRYLRRSTDHKIGQPACSGTVRLLWLREDISLILTPSRRKEGAYERLGILHPGRGNLDSSGVKFALKMHKIALGVGSEPPPPYDLVGAPLSSIVFV